MADEPLTCQELVELVADYFENVLGPGDRARFDAHVAACPRLRKLPAPMRTTVEVVGETAALDTHPEVSVLLDVFGHWRRSGA